MMWWNVGEGLRGSSILRLRRKEGVGNDGQDGDKSTKSRRPGSPFFQKQTIHINIDVDFRWNSP